MAQSRTSQLAKNAEALKGRRIVVIGTSGSGKTTLARALSVRLNIPHVEIDALHWRENWTPVSTEVLREQISDALAGDEWVIDGNYNKVRPLIWARAEVLVWLDYSRALTMSRLMRRTVHRIVTRKEMWAGNRESIKKAFFSKDSILVWGWTSFKRHKRDYPTYLADPENSHLQVFRFKSPRAADRWLKTL